MLAVALTNSHGPRGVPTRRSFEAWAEAALAGGRNVAKRARRDAVATRGRVELAIHVADVDYARALNLEFRGKDYATNVLSFPGDGAPRAGTHGDVTHLGDLLICADVVAREAAQQGKPARAHWAHLTVHGVLHLLGYDHERSPRAAGEMEAIERQVLETLGFPDPYVVEQIE